MENLVENRDFYTPTFDDTSEYCHIVWCGETRMVWLPDGENVC